VLKLFGKRRAQTSRIGVSIGPAGTALAAVDCPSPDARPRLTLCEHLQSDAAGLARLGQTLRDHGLDRAPMSVVTQAQDYELVLIETPDVLPEELRAAVRWRLKDMIGFNIDEAVVDVFGIPDQSHRSSARAAYAVAARSEALDRYAATITQATRSLDVVDIPELCLRNLCMLTDANRTGVAMLLAGEKSGLLVLVHNSFLYVARHIEWSRSYEMDGAVAANPGARPSIDASALALEVQRSLDYYESHFDHPPIGELLIAPLQAELASLATELRSVIGLRVTLFDANILLDCTAPLTAETQAQCVLAIGAALRREAA